MNKDIIYEQLTCPLSETEVMERANQQSAVWLKLKETIDEQKEVAKDYKDKRTKLESELDRLGAAVKNKEEIRSVQCRWFPNIPAEEVQLIRLDTGVVIRTRPMDDKEKQPTLFSDEGKADLPHPFDPPDGSESFEEDAAKAIEAAEESFDLPDEEVDKQTARQEIKKRRSKKTDVETVS